MARVRVLLADDHKEIRDRAVRLLEPEFDVVGAVADGDALLKASVQMKADVASSIFRCHATVKWH